MKQLFLLYDIFMNFHRLSRETFKIYKISCDFQNIDINPLVNNLWGTPTTIIALWNKSI